MKKYNEGGIIKFRVVLSFVSDGDQNGYQKEEWVHCDDMNEAAVIATARHMNEQYPLKGVAVFECVLLY